MPASPASRTPNILFLMADQMQGRVLDPDSPCITPALDRLSARGTRVTRAYTPNAVCSPARASLMTGLLPHSHGVLEVTHCVARDQCLLRDVPHWAQALSAAGYRTGYFGKWHVEHSDRPQDYGWQTACTHGSPAFKARTAALNPAERQFIAHRQPGADPHTPVPGFGPYTLYAVTDQRPEQRSCGVTTALALDWLQDQLPPNLASSAADTEDPADPAPWCCFVSVIEPHDPFIAGAAAYGLYDPDTLPTPPNWHDPMADKPGLYRKSARVFSDLSDADRRRAMAAYYAMITEIDQQIDRLLTFLETSGQLENTLVVLTSDHGELLGAHGLYCKNVGAFEETYHIPLLLAGPGIAPGATTDARIGLHDLGATLCELVGVPFSTAESRSAATLLAAPPAQAPAPWTRGYAEYFGSRIRINQRVIWDGPHKLVSNWFDFDEYYDLSTDPHELTNRIDDPAAQPTIRRLMQQVWATIQATDDHALGRCAYPPLRLAPIGMKATPA